MMGRLQKNEEATLNQSQNPLNSSVNKQQVIENPRKSSVTFILENASLHKAIVRKKKKILNSQDDYTFLLKQGKNPNDYRPDIFYEFQAII